jgi:transcription elongation factor SPT5
MVGLQIIIVKGEFKGYQGTIKDTNGPQARVELLTNNKVITIDKDKLRRKNPNTGAIEPLEDFKSMGPPSAIPGAARPFNNVGRTPNPYNNQDGSRTPGWGGTGRTPNPYASGEGGRTPAWAASSRTPNPYAGDGGRTSAWNASSKTPNPYVDNTGGSSSAWNAGGRTPNPYTAGNRTPKPGGTGSAGGSGWGGATPKPGSSGGWGGATPGRGNWGGATPRGDWGSSTSGNDSWGTPAANTAPTPYNTAPTPAPIGDDWGSHSAPTPYVAPTPGGLSAPTPGIYNSAPTPGFGVTPGFHDAAHSVQTPASAPTPFPGRFDDDGQGLGDADMDDDGEWMEGKRNIWVSIRDGYADGKFTGRRVVLRHTLRQGGMIATTATIEFMDGQEAGQQRGGVPLRFLKGVPPEKIHERAEALAGRFKGRIVVVQSGDTPDTLAVTLEESNDFEVYPKSQLVKIHTD